MGFCGWVRGFYLVAAIFERSIVTQTPKEMQHEALGTLEAYAEG